MSFKFFRKYQKIMLWFIVVITIFTFSIFSVTSTMQTCFRRVEQPVFEFISKNDGLVKVYLTEYRHAEDLVRTLARLTQVQLEEPWKEISTCSILLHEARQAGIMVSDQELTEWLAVNFSSLRSEADYKRVLSYLGFSTPKKFEETLREIIMVEKLKAFGRINSNRILSEDLYEDFKIDNEEFKLAFVSFPYERYAEEVNENSFKEEKLAEWYQGLPTVSPEVREYFSEPEKFEFDVAYIDIQKANFEDYAAIIEDMDIQVQEGEVRGYYELTKDRFKVEPEEGKAGEEAPAGEEQKEESGDGQKEDGGNDEAAAAENSDPAEGQDEEKTGEEQTGEDPAKEDPYLTFQELSPEVKEQLTNEVKLARLVDRAQIEWTEYAREKKIFGQDMMEPTGPVKKPAPPPAKEEEGVEDGEKESRGGPRLDPQAEEQESGAGGAAAGEEQESAAQEEPAGEEPAVEQEEEKTPEEFFTDLLARYRLSRDRVEGPVSLDDLPDIERYGSEALRDRLRYLKLNNAAYFRPGQEHPYLAYFVRITELVERRKKELEEVKDSAVEQYVKKLRKEAAEAEAKEFVEDLKEKARALPEVSETVEEWEKGALELAQQRIDGEEEITEERAEEIRQEELGKIQGEIDSLLARNLYAFYDDEAAVRGLTVETLDYYRKSKVRDPEFLQQENTVEKYVMSNPQVMSLDTRGVSGALWNRDLERYCVVRVVDRRYPPPGEMTEEECDEYRRREEQMRMMRLRYPQYAQQFGPSEQVDPFSFDRIVEDYQLKFYEKEKEEEPQEYPEPPE